MNKTSQSIRPVITQGRIAVAGVTELGVIINLKANDLPTVAGDYYDFAGRPADATAVPPVVAIAGKQPLYLEARAQHSLARVAYRTALADARAFAAQGIDVLKGPLGRRWNAKWAAVGFTSGSLELPRDPVSTLTFLEAHYRAHPDRETASLNLTAVKAQAALRTLDLARSALNLARESEVTTKQARDAAFERLRLRIGALRDELGTLLSDTDSRWYRFGFRRPADGETPDLVDSVQLRPGAPGEVVAEWSRARLADNYRVNWIVTGSSGVPTQVGLFSDQQAVLTGVPHPASITVMITARNSAGESAPVETVIVLA